MNKHILLSKTLTVSALLPLLEHLCKNMFPLPTWAPHFTERKYNYFNGKKQIKAFAEYSSTLNELISNL